MSTYHSDKCTRAEAEELKSKVISLLKENDIDINILEIKAFTCYGGDVRIYKEETERQSKRVSFRATGEREKNPNGIGYRIPGTKGKHMIRERDFTAFK